MVNYKRIVCEVSLVALLAVLAAATPIDTDKDFDIHYNQKQNGSANVRVNIDGVVIAVAPAESFLAAASEILDFSELLGDFDYSDLLKPTKPENPDADDKPSKPLDLPNPKPEEKPEASLLEVKPDLQESQTKPDQESQTKPAAEAPLSDVSLPDIKKQRKEGFTKKNIGSRLKNRLTHLLRPLLRKNRHN